MPLIKNLRIAMPLFATSFLCSCVVMPKTVAGYDSKCQIVTKHIELTVEEVESYDSMGCTMEDCLWNLGEVAAQATLKAAATTVISGSIAVVGNTLYWLERQGDCPAQNPLPETLPTRVEGVESISEEIISAKS